MKKLLLLPALGVMAFSALAQDRPDFENLPDPYGHTRFWSYYNPHPSNYIGSRDWWDGNAALGDWWGIRNWLDDEGYEFSSTYTNNIAGNPVGGKSAGFTYTDNINFGITLDFHKLIGWKGLTVTVSGLNRAGSSLSQEYIGNQFTVQQVFGGQTAMFYALLLEQDLWDGVFNIKAGRFAAGDDFASSPFYWLYMNNGIDGNPQALPVNTQFSAYPWAVWAARARLRPSRDSYAMMGVYQVSDRVFDRSYHGLDFSMRPDDGVLLLWQFGWTPEFFKKPLEKPVQDGGKTMESVMAKSEGKTFQSPVTTKTEEGYPGHYWFGAYYSPWSFPQFGTDDRAANSYGFYWHADQMIFREQPGSDQGLTIWSAVVFSPQQNIAKLPFQVNGGLAYQGLVPGRDNDQTMFGVVYGLFSDDYALTVAEAGGGVPDYELVFEWGYRLQFTDFAYVQPNIQWVINPGGSGTIPNALVLGAQMSVVF